MSDDNNEKALKKWSQAISRARHPSRANRVKAVSKEHLPAMGDCAVSFGAIEDLLRFMVALLLNPRNVDVSADVLDRETVRSQLRRLERAVRSRNLNDQSVAAVKGWVRRVGRAADERNDLLHGATYLGLSADAEAILFKIRKGRPWDFTVSDVQAMADRFREVEEEGWNLAERLRESLKDVDG
jgi:hypothetical protein